MSIEELFLRQIDTVDGTMEVIVHPGQPMTCISFGPFVWNLEHADLDAVICLFGRVMADPDDAHQPIVLASGDPLHLMANVQKDRAGNATSKLLFLACGPVHMRLLFSASALLLASISESRQWLRTQLIACGERVTSC